MFCRAHEDQYERHGSPYRKSYTAAELNPYRKAAYDWLRAHDSDPRVRAALEGVRALLGASGKAVEAFRLRGLSPRERANAAWARLRDAGVDPLLPLAAYLAVEMITEAKPDAERKREYRRVQTAKLIHRLASGTHKRWERELPGGGKSVTELHKYPASRGLVLLHVGQDIEGPGLLVTTEHLPSLLQSSRRESR
jgi:hypothetical protein